MISKINKITIVRFQKKKYKKNKKKIKVYISKVIFIVFSIIIYFNLVLSCEHLPRKIKQIENSFMESFPSEDLRINKLSSERILVYTCCDEFYSHYIPIFCNTLLRADKLKKIDIEIGVNINKLTNNEEKALFYLRKRYPHAKIKIDYNMFIKNKSGTFYNKYKIHPGSVRFISQPNIKNKYVYITDIDILIFVNNFYLELIDDLKRRNSCYSNIIRINTKQLTGLHFIEYNSYYPINELDNTNILDEKLLYKIMVNKGIKLNKESQYKPVFGIHLSPHRKYVSSLAPSPGWGADIYKFRWIEYLKSKDFRFIYPLLDDIIKKMIFKLNDFYAIK